MLLKEMGRLFFPVLSDKTYYIPASRLAELFRHNAPAKREYNGCMIRSKKRILEGKHLNYMLPASDQEAGNNRFLEFEEIETFITIIYYYLKEHFLEISVP